jgi:uncharacterized protein (TIGR03437 family)
LTAIVSPAVAAGKVTFYDGVTVIGTGTLSGGQAVFVTKLLSSGLHSLSASYGGGGLYLPSTAATVMQAVQALPQNGFRSAVNYNLGNNPESMTVADFNGDGKADLVVPNYMPSGTVSVLLGNGDGSFRPRASFGVGADYPASVAVSDFNGDGNADLAVANYRGNNVSILLGNGDGTFHGAVNYPVGMAPGSLVAADLNGDRKVDLAVANQGSNDVTILLGNGDGSFQPPFNYTAGSGVQFLTVGDVNGDGKADLIVVNQGGNNVSVLLGYGDGTFRTAVNYKVGEQPQFAVVGEFNGDSRADLAVVNAVGNNVSVLLGNGDGTFQAATNYNVGSLPLFAAVGDFNGDGRLDLAVPNRGSNNVSVLLGNGDGTFQTAVNYSAGSTPSATVVGDFNGDGVSDLAVANLASSNVSILLGIPIPDLTVRKTHAGNFTQSQNGASYSILVSNNGNAPTTGSVTVTDTLPVGLIVTAVSGTGWNCSLGTLTCTRSDALSPFSSYPTITLTVNVASNAQATVTNTVTVSGGGELNTANDMASDPTTVIQIPDLTITKAHSGSFVQGQTGAAFFITVRNSGTGPTAGTVAVTDTLPLGLAASSIALAPGWTCSLGTLTCIRSDVLAPGAGYPAIAVVVNVASNAASNLANTASVSGGGELNTANDTATDPVVVAAAPLINDGGVVTGANYAAQLAPGVIATLFGANLSFTSFQADVVPLPTVLGGVSVLVNGTPAPLISVSPTQINFQLPWELLGAQAAIVTTVNGSASPPQPVGLRTASPGIFSLDSSGSGQGAVQIANTAIFAAPSGVVPPGALARPVNRGEFLTIYCSGLGDVSDRPATGSAATGSSLSTTLLAATATIGGVSAPVTFAGLSPGFVGLYQVNVLVPDAAPTGPQVPVLIMVGGVTSNTVTIAVQ